MPAPLQASLERVLPAVVVAASMAMPSASVWMPRPLDGGEVAPEERLSPTTVLVNQPGQPLASLWMPQPPRDPNTDPLRPLAALAQPPDASLVQPATHWIGRLSRDEDVDWPARPAVVAVGTQPLPGGGALALDRPRELAAPAPEDHTWPTPILSGQQPQPGAAAVSIGRLSRAEDVQWPARRVMAHGPPVPPPSAITQHLIAPRELAALPPDRVGQSPLIVTPAAQPPGALIAWMKAGLDGTLPVPPTEPPFIGDAYIYDSAAPIGSVSGGTMQPGPNQSSPIGSVSGGTVQSGPNQSSPTGSVSGGTVLPSETIYD